VSSGEIDIVWQFSQPGALSQWVTTSDSDHKEGYSTCELSLSKGGNGLFMGTLSTRVPKDGRIKKAGYCNMRSMRPRVGCLEVTHHQGQQSIHVGLTSHLTCFVMLVIA